MFLKTVVRFDNTIRKHVSLLNKRSVPVPQCSLTPKNGMEVSLTIAEMYYSPFVRDYPPAVLSHQPLHILYCCILVMGPANLNCQMILNCI